MVLGNLIKRILKREKYGLAKKSQKLTKLLVIGINHYDITKPERQILKVNLPEKTTLLNFSNTTEEYECLCLVGVQKENGNYKIVEQEELEQETTEKIQGLDWFRIMRPQYAIAEDGRLFSDINLPILSDNFYREAIAYLKNYEDKSIY